MKKQEKTIQMLNENIEQMKPHLPNRVNFMRNIFNWFPIHHDSVVMINFSVIVNIMPTF